MAILGDTRDIGPMETTVFMKALGYPPANGQEEMFRRRLDVVIDEYERTMYEVLRNARRMGVMMYEFKDFSKVFTISEVRIKFFDKKTLEDLEMRIKWGDGPYIDSSFHVSSPENLSDLSDFVAKVWNSFVEITPNKEPSAVSDSK